MADGRRKVEEVRNPHVVSKIGTVWGFFVIVREFYLRFGGWRAAYSELAGKQGQRLTTWGSSQCPTMRASG